MTAQKPMPSDTRLMVAIDPDALDQILQELASIRSALQAAQVVPKPEWMDAGDYAKQRGVSRRTVMNWIARGEVESRRTGSKTEVRFSRGA